MQKIRQYTIAFESDPVNLRDAVMKGIQKGWQPFGSPMVDSTDNLSIDPVYCQAMVKYEE